MRLRTKKENFFPFFDRYRYVSFCLDFHFTSNRFQWGFLFSVYFLFLSCSSFSLRWFASIVYIHTHTHVRLPSILVIVRHAVLDANYFLLKYTHSSTHKSASTTCVHKNVRYLLRMRWRHEKWKKKRERRAVTNSIEIMQASRTHPKIHINKIYWIFSSIEDGAVSILFILSCIALASHWIDEEF